MNTAIGRGDAVAADADALILFAVEAQPPRFSTPADGLIGQLFETGEFTGKPGESAILHGPQGFQAKRLILAGLGKSGSDPHAVRKAMGTALRLAKSKSAHTVAAVLTGEAQTEGCVEAAIEGAILGNFEPDVHKTGPEKTALRIDSFTLLVPGADGAVDAAFERGRILAESQNLTRELINEPSNILVPLELARRARAMAEEAGLECDILDEDRMRQIGMGSLLAVAMGSDAPPAMAVIRYRPAGDAVPGIHLGLVGKGVTFDSGGISIKPADGMEKMKYDMAGAAAVIGAMRAIALLKPGIAVTGYAPMVENMINGRAQRPGDIVKTLSGKTVEVLNTDAEGRLILNDALTYAQRDGCTHLVDAATLTGSVVIALGNVNVGVFPNDDALCERLLASAARQGEKMWRMPMDEEYREPLKSAFADLPNIGTRYGGSISAAHFLKTFADPLPWVHLDIAGTAWLDEAKPHMAKGPSGVCVRTFVDLALNWQ